MACAPLERSGRCHPVSRRKSIMSHIRRSTASSWGWAEEGQKAQKQDSGTLLFVSLRWIDHTPEAEHRAGEGERRLSSIPYDVYISVRPPPCRYSETRSELEEADYSFYSFPLMSASKSRGPCRVRGRFSSEVGKLARRGCLCPYVTRPLPLSRHFE